MKCDELKAKRHFDEDTGIIFSFYGKAEVDAAIAELKQKLEDTQATAYTEMVDAGVRECRLKRALYKACANWALAKMEYAQFDSNVFMFGVTTDKEVSWESMMKKCQAKMEKCK